jgi:predicted nucleic acid-binding protein
MTPVTIVVSDTSPLNYLLLCDAADVLPRLFGKILVPEAVVAELQSEDAPPNVRSWAETLPSWVEIRNPTRVNIAPRLHTGEHDAICLALEVQADLLLIDERVGRRVAKELGLSVVGTLGILERAARNDLLDLPTTIDRLRRTTFKVDPSLLKALLERDAARRSQLE